MFPIWLLSTLSEDEKVTLEKIYEIYRKYMFYKANIILQNRDNAEDCVIQTFINLSGLLGKIDDVSSNRTKAFIRTVTRYTALNMLRKIKADTIRDNNQTKKTYIDDVDLQDLNLELLINDMKVSVNNADIELFIFKYAYGLKSKEIAKITGHSISDINVRIHRAKTKMRKDKNIQAYKGGDNE